MNAPVSAGRRRRGFTLVELLVALALVTLIMQLFAQVFQTASNSIGKQRGIAENDQRARALSVLLQQDVQNRTMKSVLPYLLGEDSISPGDLRYPDYANYNGSDRPRDGYFEYSEGDPNSGTDDSLHFTVQVNKAAAPFYGRATPLTDPSNPALLTGNPDQPEFDDLETSPNGAASSHYAQISWFLRRGNLYRRVLLLREPATSSLALQPTTSTAPAVPFFDPSNGFYPYNSSGTNSAIANPRLTSGAIDFWQDFDYSAFFDPGMAGAQFLGIDSSTNSLQPKTVFSLCDPRRRFGHDHVTGLPKEWVGDTPSGSPVNTGATYIGRYTHEETSNVNFQYPHSIPGSGNPMAPLNGNLVDTNNDGAVDVFQQGSRRGEDIVMPRVLEFDVKVWDEDLLQFVDLGRTGMGGDFDRTRNNIPLYGPIQNPVNVSSANPDPLGRTNNVFDTFSPNWNPATPVPPTWPGYNPTNNVMPPYYPRIKKAGVYWQANSNAYFVPTYVGGLKTVDGSTIEDPNNPQLYYECVGTFGPSPSTGAVKPTFSPIVDGVAADYAVDGMGVRTGSGYYWQTRYNARRLKALQITIRFHDLTSDQIRQVTLTESLITPANQ